MKFLLSRNKISASEEIVSFNPRECRIGPFWLYIEKSAAVFRSGPYHLINEGYLRDLSGMVDDLENQQRGVIEGISLQWPLPSNITGSFSALLVNEATACITLCTDLVGLYPLYYLLTDEGIFISNSIISVGRAAQVPFDEAGIAQRALGPEFSNVGSRTILRGCKRLLPGEYLRINQTGGIEERKFDNTLYQNITSSSQSHSLEQDYWSAYKEEVKYCLQDAKKVNLALSGGIDSRVVLGAIPDSKDLTCYTFGAPENYESLIAKRLACKKGAVFNACYHPEVYFPAPETMKEYTLKTEALQLCSWLEITEKVEHTGREPLLLGELCEALPGRKISAFSSKEFRRQNFIKYYLFDKDYEFTRATEENFHAWKKKVSRQYHIYYYGRSLDKLEISLSQKELIASLQSDLEEIFERIEAHHLPYAELYDELFSWYTYTRMRLSKQLLTAGISFDAYSPAMSLQMLRKTSSLHPNIRLNYRFVKRLFKKNPELRKFYRIPTSQAPLIPQDFPDFMKFGMWGIRSGIDQLLIKRMMKSRDASLRYRLFPSINWAEVYQHPKMEEHLKAYFLNNHLGKEYFQGIFNQAVARKNLKAWPFANMNIINAASLNVELDLIKAKKYSPKNEV